MVESTTQEMVVFVLQVESYFIFWSPDCFVTSSYSLSID